MRVDRDIFTSDISDLITNFLTTEDAYSLGFLSTFVIQTPSGIPKRCPINRGLCQEFRNDTECEFEYATVSSPETLLPSGPYFVYSNGIHEAWRLYPDSLSSFGITVVPDAARVMYEDYFVTFRICEKLIVVLRYSVLTTLEQDGIWKKVAVPSRLYRKSSAEKPLARARVSVKGNFELAGIKTTMTNRCFTELYPVETPPGRICGETRRAGCHYCWEDMDVFFRIR